jgi:hypothetical protein
MAASLLGQYGGGKGEKTKKKTESETISFSEDAARKVGQTARAVQYKTRIGQALKDVAEEVAATPIADSQKELLALSKLAPAERTAVLSTLTAGNATSVKQAVKQQVSAAIKAAPQALPQGPFPMLFLGFHSFY